MDAPKFLALEEVLEIHEDQITRYGGSLGLRDRALLESAIGNKRVGVATALVFLGMNEIEVENDEPAFSELAVGVATGRVDKAAIALFLRSRVSPSS